MSKMPKVETHTRSTQEQFVDNLFFLVITGFIVWILDKFFSFLFTSFTFRTEEDIQELEEQDTEKRMNRREARLDRYDADESDPMHQFQLRFLTNKEEYKNDPDNDWFLAWYKAWQEGKIRDTYLRWSPPMYESGNIANTFLAYLNIQINLHKKASLYRKQLFLANIRACYPEFTPTFRGLEQDIAGYSGETEEEELKSQLVGQLVENGVPQEVSKFIANSSKPQKYLDSIEEIKALCQTVQNHQVCIFMLENDIKMGSYKAECVSYVIGKYGLSKKIALALIKKEITEDNVEYIAERLDSMKSWMGLNLYRKRDNGKYLIDELVDELIETCRAENRARKVSAACSRK